MITKYSSKIGIEIILIAYLPFISLFYFVYSEFNLIGTIVIVVLFVFITYLLLSTVYTINNNSKKLVVKSGYFYRKIDIEHIKTIKKSKSWISSPALSIDRIEISYNKYDSVLISPKNREQFIQELSAINPNIIVEI
ncbi:PH domain-containing protein [Faecalibacter rhinopitheci]|uniref:PH domain-containing protein n=1 Tax=Faecalibacter rhinopitheci TaxID=2779678 RepID=A0A8J7KDX1_9FLAO|nr:PH domain-containing protein [Faecalibacter rhinopitheci]MBF0597811.1 PH domain-containing protein [Faecalibacter rhinopitheci]